MILKRRLNPRGLRRCQQQFFRDLEVLAISNTSWLRDRVRQYYFAFGREYWLWRVAIEPRYDGPNRVLKRIGTAKEVAQNNNFSANWIFRAR